MVGVHRRRDCIAIAQGIAANRVVVDVREHNPVREERAALRDVDARTRHELYDGARLDKDRVDRRHDDGLIDHMHLVRRPDLVLRERAAMHDHILVVGDAEHLLHSRQRLAVDVENVVFQCVITHRILREVEVKRASLGRRDFLQCLFAVVCLQCHAQHRCFARVVWLPHTAVLDCLRVVKEERLSLDVPVDSKFIGLGLALSQRNLSLGDIIRLEHS